MHTTPKPTDAHAVVTTDETIVVHVHRHETPADELLEFPFGLEEAAARKLIRAGHLLAAKIGRKLYAKRSDLVALVDKLASAPPKARPTSADPKAAYLALVGKGGAR